MINTMTPSDYVVCVTALSFAAMTTTLLFVQTRRVGSIVFWRLGRLGGSIHIAAKYPRVKSKRGRQQLNGKLLPSHLKTRRA
jgi:hypothetical protein